MTRTGRSPGRRVAAVGVGASPSSITMRAAQDLDTWYRQNGCTGCDDMGSDLRVRTLTFKAAVLLDPATQNNVSLNVSTPLAQSGFGPGTDKALSLVLGATRLSSGHCTDDYGNCIVGGLQSPAIPLELQAIANTLGINVAAVIQQAKQIPQTDATLKALIERVVAMFQAFTAQLKTALGSKEQPAPPPRPVVDVPPTTPPQALMPAKTSNVGVALGIVGIALVAVGTGAVIMTAAQRRKAKRK